MATSLFKAQQRVRFKDDGRMGTTVRRNRPYDQWLVKLDTPTTQHPNGLTWWWASDMEPCQTKAKGEL
jgi:hypothetical protein